MPWFDPNPSVANLDFWRSWPARNRRLVPTWPVPGTIRIDPKYRLHHCHGDMLAIASRWGLWFTRISVPYDPDDIGLAGVGWWDALVRGVDHLGFTTAQSVDGFTCDVNIKAFDQLPTQPLPGVEVQIDMTHPVHGLQTQRGEWPKTALHDAFRWDINTRLWDGDPKWYWPVVFSSPEPIRRIELFAADECFEFPFLPVGFAEFNGIDAYIALTQNLPSTNSPFIIELEVSWNAVNEQPFFGIGSSGGFGGMRTNDDFTLGNLRRATSFTPTLDTWYTWRLEFEQNGQLRYDLIIDGNNVWGQVTNRQFLAFNRIGAYKQGVGGSLWADCKIRNLKFWDGAPPSTTLQLDMPLIENALDLSSNANHGTTFNMDLPSV